MIYLNKYFLDVIRKEFICFEGVVGRKKFWMFFVFAVSIGWVMSFIPLIRYIYAFIVILPFLGLAARRLKDAGLDPLLLLLCLLPVLGPLAVLVMCALPGKAQIQA